MTPFTLSRSTWRVLALSLFLAAPLAHAAEDRDPPTRAGRVVTVIGDAWLFDHESREWVHLERNQTVGEGDRVRTDERSRVGLRVGSTSLWVDERSDLELSQLDEGQTLLSLDRGDVALRLRSQEMAQETRLRTREGTISPETTGLYRVEQLDRGTKAYNWQGRLRFDWQQAQMAAPVWLAENEQAEFWWPGGPRTERSRLYTDPFGDWVYAEARNEGDLSPPRYVSAEMTGAEDLDRYGRWESSGDYGAVWIPTVVVPGWAPYRYGHWAWTRHWGWAWVDDTPWGFAPFHYGRWVMWRDRWCWSPGSYVARPVYAPALVGWIGAPVAPGVSIGINISLGSRPAPPSYGWYPLAPREVYVPSYQHSPRYDHRINDRPDWRNARDPITVQRPHQYRDAPNAISYLPQQGGAIQALPAKPDKVWRDARPITGAPSRGDLAPMLPTRPQPVRSAEPARDGAPVTGWRSENWQARRERDRAAEVPAAMGQPQPQAQQPGGWRNDGGLPVRRERVEPAPQPIAVPQPAPQVPLPAQGEAQWRREHSAPNLPQAQPMPQAVPAQVEPQRRIPMPERREPEAAPRIQQPMPVPVPVPVPQIQQPMPQRQIEVPRVQMPQPQPQAQPAPQQRQQPRNDDGPQRRHGGPPDKKENER